MDNIWPQHSTNKSYKQKTGGRRQDLCSVCSYTSQVYYASIHQTHIYYASIRITHPASILSKYTPNAHILRKYTHNTSNLQAYRILRKYTHNGNHGNRLLPWLCMHIDAIPGVTMAMAADLPGDSMARLHAASFQATPWQGLKTTRRNRS